MANAMGSAQMGNSGSAPGTSSYGLPGYGATFSQMQRNGYARPAQRGTLDPWTQQSYGSAPGQQNPGSTQYPGIVTPGQPPQAPQAPNMHPANTQTVPGQVAAAPLGQSAMQPPPGSGWKVTGAPPTFTSPMVNPMPSNPNLQEYQAAAQPSPQSTNPQAGTSQMGDALQKLLMQGLNNPSAYGAPQSVDTFKALNQQLTQNYGIQGQKLNEELARRGLSDSTVAAGRYNDLNVEQSRAQALLAQNIATQQAQTYGADRTQALQAAMGYGQNQFNNQMQTAQFGNTQDQQQVALLMQLMGITSGGGG